MCTGYNDVKRGSSPLSLSMPKSTQLEQVGDGMFLFPVKWCPSATYSVLIAVMGWSILLSCRCGQAFLGLLLLVTLRCHNSCSHPPPGLPLLVRASTRATSAHLLMSCFTFLHANFD